MQVYLLKSDIKFTNMIPAELTFKYCFICFFLAAWCSSRFTTNIVSGHVVIFQRPVPDWTGSPAGLRPAPVQVWVFLTGYLLLRTLILQYPPWPRCQGVNDFQQMVQGSRRNTLKWVFDLRENVRALSCDVGLLVSVAVCVSLCSCVNVAAGFHLIAQKLVYGSSPSVLLKLSRWNYRHIISTLKEAANCLSHTFVFTLPFLVSLDRSCETPRSLFPKILTCFHAGSDNQVRGHCSYSNGHV